MFLKAIVKLINQPLDNMANPVKLEMTEQDQDQDQSHAFWTSTIGHIFKSYKQNKYRIK